MKMTKDSAMVLAEKVVVECENDERDNAIEVISRAILTACEEEARQTQAAVEGEREACKDCIVNLTPYGCGSITEFAFKAAKSILDRGTTNALDEERRKARLEGIQYALDCALALPGPNHPIWKEIKTLQTPERKG